MAHYLIIVKDGESSYNTKTVEAKNMVRAAELFFSDPDGPKTATIQRIAGPPKTITLSVETVTKVEIE